MNEYVKQSIDSRKLAFSNAYKLTDKYQKKVDELFNKIEGLGKECNDAMDFETRFSTSPLNQEYIDLFSEIATKCEAITRETVIDPTVKSDKEYLMDEVASDAKYIIDDITMPARRKAREELDNKLRDTPLGKLEQASNTLSVFKRIFKK